MSQPQQIIYSTPNNDFSIVDNSPASTTTTLAGPTNSSPIGFDTVAVARVPSGANSQATNPFGDTGSTTLDSVNDQAYQDPSIGTFVGNPVSGVVPVTKTVSTVLNDAQKGLRLLFKNPAIILF